MDSYRKFRTIGYYRSDRCPICDKDRTIEAYDDKNNPVQLSRYIDMYQLDRLVNTKKLVYMRCKECKQRFSIDWIDKDYMVPLRDTRKIDKFLINFQQSNKEI